MDPVKGIEELFKAFAKPCEEDIQELYKCLIRMIGYSWKALFASAAIVDLSPTKTVDEVTHIDKGMTSPSFKQAGIRGFAGFSTDPLLNKEDLDELTKPFKMEDKDYAVTVNVNCAGKAKETAAAFQGLFDTLLAIIKSIPLGEKIMELLETKIEAVGEKVILCIQIKPAHRAICNAVFAFFKVLFTLVGKNESYSILAELDTDLEEAVLDYPKYYSKIQTAYSVKYKAVARALRHKIRMRNSCGFFKFNSGFFTSSPFMKTLFMLESIVYLGEVYMEKDEILPARDKEFMDFARARAEFAGIIENPLLLKVWEFIRDFVDNAEVKILCPDFVFKFGLKFKGLKKLMTTIIPA